MSRETGPEGPREQSVTLAPEEVRAVRWLLNFWGAELSPDQHKATPPTREELHALAARLEAAG